MRYSLNLSLSTCQSPTRNIPLEAKSLKCSGNVEWRMFYSRFNTIAKHYRWNDDQCLMILILVVEGSVHGSLNLLTGRGTLTFPQVVDKFDVRFGGGGCRQLFRSNVSQCVKSPLNPLNSARTGLWKRPIKIGNVLDLQSNVSAGGLLVPEGLYRPFARYFGTCFNIRI
jgi:hypothetical protein